MRRRADKATRRARTMLVGAVVVSALVLVAWFPAGALYSQRKSLSSASAQLQQLRQQNRALEQEKQRLFEPSEIDRIARAQFDFVEPDQRAFQVLPPVSKGGSAGATGGDPGMAPLASPNAGIDSDLDGSPGATGSGSAGGAASTGSSSNSSGGATGGSGGSRTGHQQKATTGSTGSAGAAPHPGLWGRIVQNLEFWR